MPGLSFENWKNRERSTGEELVVNLPRRALFDPEPDPDPDPDPDFDTRPFLSRPKVVVVKPEPQLVQPILPVIVKGGDRPDDPAVRKLPTATEPNAATAAAAATAQRGNRVCFGALLIFVLVVFLWTLQGPSDDLGASIPLTFRGDGSAVVGRARPPHPPPIADLAAVQEV